MDLKLVKEFVHSRKAAYSAKLIHTNIKRAFSKREGLFIFIYITISILVKKTNLNPIANEFLYILSIKTSNQKMYYLFLYCG